MQQRFEIASESNNARSALYEVAFERRRQRPLAGSAAPIDVAACGSDVGTHGLIWFVMVAYGFPGFLLLAAWMIAHVLSSTMPAPNPIALWAHVAIVVFIVQSPIYGLLPQLTIVGLGRPRIALRAQQLGSETDDPRDGWRSMRACTP